MFWTKVVGVTFDGRQEIIDAMTGDETLMLKVEPDNEYDDHAVAVVVNGEKSIGYIAKSTNVDIFDKLVAGESVIIDDFNITGGEDGQSYGVNIHIKMPGRKNAKALKKIKPEIGEGYVYFDEEEHSYYDEEGNPMLSGSVFEKNETGEIDLSYAARAMAKSTGIDKSEIEKLWDINGELSREFGTLIHSALETYIKHQDSMKEIDKMKEREHTAQNWMPNTLGQIVDDYLSYNDVENAQAEVFVRYNGFCGFIDQLEWLTKDKVIIHDYKVISEHKDVKTEHYGKLPKYTLQQSFYRAILEKNDIKVDALYLDVFGGDKWMKVMLKPIHLDLDEL